MTGQLRKSSSVTCSPAIDNADAEEHGDLMQPRLASYPVDATSRKQAVNQTARLDALQRVEMFRGLSKRNLIRIDQLSVVRTAYEGEVVVTEGDTGTEMMIVLDGRASVRRGSRKLGELSRGEVFGEMALLDDQTRSATVTAIEPMRMLAISGPAFRKLLTKVPILTEAVLSSLSSRLRAANAAADL